MLTTAIPEIGVVATGDRRGIMAGAERAATKTGEAYSHESNWIPEDKKVSKEF